MPNRTPPRVTANLGVLAQAVALAIALAGCSPAPAPSPVVSAAGPSSSVAPTTTPTPFVTPASCTGILGQAWLDKFLSWNLALTAGPGSPSGDIPERVPPEAEPGSIQCQWNTTGATSTAGIDYVEIDAGPVTDLSRGPIVAFLNGLHETTSTAAGVTKYFTNGNESVPAQLDVLRAGSWITVLVSPSGADNFDQATQLAHEVETVVHAAD